MEFRQLIEIVDDEPVFETGLLLAGNAHPADVRKQLSRWTQAKYAIAIVIEQRTNARGSEQDAIEIGKKLLATILD